MIQELVHDQSFVERHKQHVEGKGASIDLPGNIFELVETCHIATANNDKHSIHLVERDCQ
jgi:hypothetical protein